ncbi:hypothetical protein HpNP123_07180 [Helicobacter pylori]
MMGIKTKNLLNLGFGFALIWIIKTLKGIFKINIKELAQDTSDNFLKRFLGDLMGLKKRGGVVSKSPYPL